MYPQNQGQIANLNDTFIGLTAPLNFRGNRRCNLVQAIRNSPLKNGNCGAGADEAQSVNSPYEISLYLGYCGMGGAKFVHSSFLFRAKSAGAEFIQKTHQGTLKLRFH